MFFKNLFVFAALLALTACSCPKSYNIALLGDIHYDRADLHDAEVYKKFNPKVPFAKGVVNKDGLYSWRSQTLWATESLGYDPKSTPKNIKMWKKDLPELLDNAAKTAAEKKSLYLFQLGDMVQGDAGTYKLHKEMLSGGYSAMTSRFDCPVLVSLGNHDTRGPGGMQSWQEIIETAYDANVKNIVRKNSNFYFNLKGDIYFFYDLLNPDLDMLEAAVKLPCRYFFFISHVPVIPSHSSLIKNIVSDDTERLVSLLLKRNAIVLSGHTHGMTLARYQCGKNSITQFIINSTLRNPKIQKQFKRQVIFGKAPKKQPPKAVALWNKLFKDKINVKLQTSGSGYAIMRVSDEGVFIDFYSAGKGMTTFTLRKN